MATIRSPIRTHLSAEEQDRLEQEAAARGVSVSQCIRDCLREYFALRAEMATALEVPGRPGDRHSGIIHAVLARTEERLAASLDAQAEPVSRLRDQIQVVQAMLDRLALLYLVHTPDIAPAQREAALASGTRRHASWHRAVARAVQSGEGTGGLPIGDVAERGGS